MAAESGTLTELVEGRSWSGGGLGWQTAQELVDGFLEFWRHNDAILRVVDLGAAEGDKRFSKIRLKVLNAVESSLAGAVSELQAKGRIDKDVNPGAVAGSLVAMLAAVASHQKGFSSWGVKQAEIKPNLALLVHLGVTGRKPTK